MTHQQRCETCKNWDNFYHGCNLFVFEVRLDKKKETIRPYLHEDGYKTIEFVGCASHSDLKSKREKVWVVTESRFEWYEIKHICSTKEVALQRWAEVRDELIKTNQHMVEYCIKEGLSDGKDWQKNIELLQKLKPGESCGCDYPDLKEWDLE